MDRFLRLNVSFFRCRTPRTVLAYLWLVGLLSGTVVSLLADTLLSSTMHAAIHGSMSIFGLLAALLLPLCFTAFAVYISRPSLVFPLVLLKAFLFSFIGAGLLTSFGTAAWLLRCLLMFSDSLVLPILWWTWLQCFSEDRCTVLRCCAVSAIFVIVIGCFDFALVAPFLARLL